MPFYPAQINKHEIRNPFAKNYDRPKASFGSARNLSIRFVFGCAGCAQFWSRKAVDCCCRDIKITLILNRGHRSEKAFSVLLFCRPIMRFGRIYRTTIIHGHESKYVHKHPTWVQNRIFLFRKSNFGGRQRCRWQQWIRNRLLWWRNETQITLAWRRRGLKNFWKYFDFRCKNVLFYSVWPNARN